MKRIILLTSILLIFSNLIAQNSKLEIAPLNPNFLKYMELKKKGALQKFTADGRRLGYVPHSLDFKAKTPANIRGILATPHSYDLRIEGTVSSVKDQGTCGTCWTFATMGSIESRWMDMGLAESDLSENNLVYGHFFELDPDSGGNSAMSTAYLSRRGGPVSETDDPYEGCSGSYHPGLTPQAYVTDVRFLPNDAEVLKQLIVDSGAVYTNMYWDPAYYDDDGGNHPFTYYYDGANPSTNHAVLLVGWDSTKVTDASSDGAWIIKNSWGTGFGESGYFYISFYDTRINSNPAYWPTRLAYNANATVHLIDTLGATGSAGYSVPLGYGLIQFTIAAGQSITKLGTWVTASNTTISFSVYDSFNGTTLSNLLGSIGNQVCEYPGYYTFYLPSRIDITSLNDIYILVKYDSPGETHPIPIEMAVTDYADPAIESGVCWVSPNGSSSWAPIGSSTGNNWDLCIKAYTVTTVTSINNSSPSSLPRKLELFQNSPNPFNPSTKIKFNLGTRGHVKITIYDILGKTVALLLNETLNAGNNQEVTWYGKNDRGESAPSGIYFYSLETKEGVYTKKMLLVR